MNIFVTGGTGFIGSTLIKELDVKGYKVTTTIRNSEILLPSGIKKCFISDIGTEYDWNDSLKGQETVIHTAARVHIMNDRSRSALDDFRRINTIGTLNLARAASNAGVKRFIFLSSIKVNGEMTENGRPFSAEDLPMPVDPYGISKLEAEIGLKKIAENSCMEVVVIRPTMVYGPGVKGNLLSLIKIVDKRIPLPLGNVDNLRSMVALDNLIHFIICCITHVNAANQVFLVSDGHDISTTDLVLKIGLTLNKPVIFLPIPIRVIKQVGIFFGQKKIINRLYRSLQVDISKNKEYLNWNPPIDINQEMDKMIKFYRSERGLI